MRVSIVVSNYNYERFLDGAIRSAIEQDYADKEVIVVDDGSSDGSRALMSAWGDTIRPVYQSNGGQISAYNAGFERATGDIVIFLDADDLLDRSACRRIVDAFAPGVAKVHFRLRLVDAEGAALAATIPTRMAQGDLAHRLRALGELYESAPGSGNAYLSSALRRLMPLPSDENDRHGADFFAIYGISLLGQVRIAGPEPLGSYRVHRPTTGDALVFGNASRDSQEPLRMYRRYDRMRGWVIARLGSEYVLPPAAPEFSLEKQGYATAIFSAASYKRGLQAGSSLLRSNVLPAIGRMDGSWALRAGLAGWAVAVLLLPRKAGLPLARYICNPASR
jgi:glycosyltransferase involved in cell wall biosynthesis